MRVHNLPGSNKNTTSFATDLTVSIFFSVCVYLQQNKSVSDTPGGNRNQKVTEATLIEKLSKCSWKWTYSFAREAVEEPDGGSAMKKPEKRQKFCAFPVQ